MISLNENLGGSVSLAEIEKHAKAYADIRDQRNTLVAEANEKIERIKRDLLPVLRKLTAREAEKFSALYAAIEAAPELFTAPRTQVFHGLKVGFQKGKGKLEIADPARTLQKIKEVLDCPENYIRVEESPNREALMQLPAADLKKLGATITDTGDVVVIKPTDGALDKIAKALLKDAIAEKEEVPS